MDFSKFLSLLGVVFLTLTLIFYLNPIWPRFPWDININRPGFGIYFPVVSSIVVAVLMTFLLGFFKL